MSKVQREQKTNRAGELLRVLLVGTAAGLGSFVGLGPADAVASGSPTAIAATSTAPACASFAAGDFKCFDSVAAMNSAIDAYDSGVSPDTGCGSSPWVYLYQTPYFGGQVLALDNVGYWANLDALGFGNKMSSWINTSSCVAYASKSTGGAAPWLTMSANSSSVEVPSNWIDTANSTEIY